MVHDVRELKRSKRSMWCTYGTSLTPAKALAAVEELVLQLGAKPSMRDERQLIATTSGRQAKLHGIFKTPPVSMPLRLGVDVAEVEEGTQVRVRLDESFGFQMFLGPARQTFEEKYRLAFEQLDAELKQALGASPLKERGWPPPRAAGSASTSRARLVVAILFSTVGFGGGMALLFGLMEGSWRIGLVVGGIAGVVFTSALFVAMAKKGKLQSHMGATVDLLAQQDAGRQVLLGKKPPQGPDVDPRVEAEAQRIVGERKRTIRRSRIVGVLVALPVMLVSAAVLIATETFGTVVGFAGAAWFFYRVVATRFLCRERIVLVLRRFGLYGKEKRVLPDFLGDVCAGLAVPITIQDSSFTGDLPMGLQALQRYLAPLVSAGAGVGAVFLLPGMWEEIPLLAGVLGVGTFLGVYALFAQLASRLGVSSANDNNYSRVVRKLLSWIRKRRGFYSGTRVMTLPDERWQDGILMCLKEADAIVIDVTDISGNVIWEIGEAFARVPAESIIIAWTSGAEGDAGDMPERVREILESVVGSDKLAHCAQRPYPQSRDSIPAFLQDVFVADLARCFVHR